MPPQTPPPDKHKRLALDPKFDLRGRRFDLRGRKYPRTAACCLFVLITQALLLSRDMGWCLLFSYGVFIAAAAATAVVGREKVAPLTGVVLTAFPGILQVYVFDSANPAPLWCLALVPAALLLWWTVPPACSGLSARPGPPPPPKFKDKSREDRIRCMELAARIAVEFARTDVFFTSAKREAIHGFFAEVLGIAGARLGSVRVIVREEEDLPGNILTLERASLDPRGQERFFPDIVEERLRELLRDFRRSCSHESHLTLLLLLFRVARASGPDVDAARELAWTIGLALDLSPRELADVETRSCGPEADRPG